jgi:membrane dipeptidase
MIDASPLHRDAIIIDATCPLARSRPYIDWWREGGVTAVAPTITGMTGNARSGLQLIGGWHRYARERNDTIIVREAADIERAKAAGKIGLILHCQGTAIIEDELDFLDAYAAAGLRVVQLCYNRRNLIGDGAAERTDSGLSYFGIDVIKRLNALKMLIDCSHTGVRTTFDAIETSTAPVVISHANAFQVHSNRRNVPDDLIRAIAQTGGLVGTVGFPPFVADTNRPTLDQFIDDIVYRWN